MLMKRLTVMALGALVLTLAGCATSGAGETGNTGALATTTADKSLQYAQCMRENGVPDYQDPGPDGGVKIDGKADPAKAKALMEAQGKCRQYAPGVSSDGSGPSEADVENIRKYAQCMRANGVPNFPDPDSQGRITVDSEGGLKLDSPEFKAADEKCASLKGSPGSGK
jgi:hypothetical protein